MRARIFSFMKRPAVVAAVSVLALRGLTLSSRFLLSLLLARMLSPDEMAQYGLMTASLAFALLALGLEFYSHTLRELVPASMDRRAEIIANQIALAMATFFAIGSLSTVAVITGLFPAKLVPWFLLILASEHISLEATRILIITSRPIRAYVGVFLRGGLWVYVIAGLMLFAPALRSLETVLVLWAVGGISSIIFAAVSLRELPWRGLKKKPDWPWIYSGLLVARPFMLTSAGALTISYVDRFMIDGLAGRDALGIYTFYSTVSIGILSLGASVSQQFLPKVIGAYSSDATEFRRSVRTFFWSLLGVSGAVTAAAAILISPIVSFFQLTAYAQSSGVFVLMAPAVLLRIMADVPSYVLYAAHADDKLLLCNLGSAVVSVLLNAALIPLLGMYGAALSSCIASGVLLFVLAIFATQILREPGIDVEGREPVGRSKDSEMLYR